MSIYYKVRAFDIEEYFFEQSDKVNHRWPLADKTVTDVTLKTKQLRLLIIRPL
jgi:hypothetical protein